MKKAKKSSHIRQKKTQNCTPITIETMEVKRAKISAYPPQKEKTKISEWFMVGLTTVLAVIGYLTYTVYKQQLEVYKNQLAVQKTETRAWVAFSSISGFPAGPSNDGSFTVKFKNVGKTPATQIHVWINKAISEKGVPPFDIDTLVGKEGGSMGADSEWIFPEIHPTIKDRFIFGTIWYTDVYKVMHWTRFCFQIPKTGMNMTVMGFHNEMDHNED